MSRFKFQFWLNADKDDELLVAETIDELKTRRSFSAAVRDGIMIVNELRQGKIDLLVKLYPFVLDAIATLTPTPPTPDTGNLERQIADLKRILLEQGRVDPDAPMVAAPPLKQLSKGMGGHTVAFTAPLEDDDGSELVLKVASVNTGANLTASFAKMGLFG